MHSVKVQCFGCGTEKNPATPERYPFADDFLTQDEPLQPLHVIECGNMDGHWCAVVICHVCIHDLQPDMWIDEKGWMSLNPQVPFSRLPPMTYGDAKWDPVPYARAIGRCTD